ncbi:MAG: flagellar hook-basal body complex protein FliE [Vulcanimicrobiaceae bacterium]
MDISAYSKAISAVTPGTFVPDIGTQAPASTPLPSDQATAGGAGVSFKDTVKSLLDDVNAKQVTADQKSMAIATGKSHDMEGTVKAVEEASLAMEMTLAVRNKLLAAYTEVGRMQF